MRPDPNTSGDSLPLAGLAHVHQLCDEFENAVRAGAAPKIEDFIARLEQGFDGPDTRTALLLALLELEIELRRARGERPSIEEYSARFPEHAALVAAAFADSSMRTDRPGNRDAIGRNLLFGMLALQNNFISREALLSAFNAWLADKTKSLGAILVDQGKLSATRLAILDGLVAEHERDNGGDPEITLAAVRSADDELEFLRAINDAHVEASLAAVRAHRAVPQGSDVPTDMWVGAARASMGDGRFRILRDHKEGGMGKVSVASDVELNRTVALKEIKPEYAADDLIRSRFVVEAEITGAWTPGNRAGVRPGPPRRRPALLCDAADQG